MNKSLGVILLLLVVVFSCNSSEKNHLSGYDGQKVITAIDSLLKTENYETALSICNKYIDAGNKTPNLIIRKAFCLGKLNQNTSALAELDYIIENTPDSLHDTSDFFGHFFFRSQSLIFRAEIFYTIGNLKEAYINMEKVYNLDSNNINIILKMASISRKVGLKDKEFYFEKRAYGIDSTNVILIGNIGYQYLKEKQPYIAIEYYDKAIKYNTTDFGLYLARACAYKMIGDFEHASGDFKKSIELNPNNAETYAHYGELYLIQGNEYRKEACELFHKAKALGFDFKSRTFDSGTKNYEYVYLKLCVE